MARVRGTTRRPELKEAIKETAWRQIAEHGAAALSLRAIARELGITAPAIYNYYSRRDDLVTALVVDAFTSFGDAQRAARDAVPADDPVGRLNALGSAYRQWATSNTERYQLIFGAPVPDYGPPPEQVLPSGARALSVLVGLVEERRVAGALRVSGLPKLTPGYAKSFDFWKTYGGAADERSLCVALIIWARAHGLVSLEIGGHLPPFGAHGDALYHFEMAAVVHQFIRE